MGWTRRDVVIGAVALASIGAASRGTKALAAPSGRTIRVGALLSGTPERWTMIEKAVSAGLSEHGYFEGKNLEVVKRSREVVGSGLAITHSPSVPSLGALQDELDCKT